MKRKLCLLFILLGWLVLSCSRTVSYEHKFQYHTWKRFDTLSFPIDGLKSDKARHVKIRLSYQQSFPTSDLPIIATLVSPSGEERTIEKRIWLKTLDGQPKGNYINDRFVLEQILWYEIYFREKGTYRLLIESLHPKFEVSGILSLQVEIGKGALPLPKPQPGNFH
ncbi:MAG: hypothetical protein HPY80_05090 [Bacteroidales bacterium]|jgi:gliding motility-associated lipoprotein GldH|nr:gliding motility lipoprotein GldH [Bacteroidales bacterium]NPV36028.1 hypothetical protein [Bacteroidales bacterium]